MVSDTLSTRRQPARLAADEIDKKKARQERQTALIFALLIGVLAASGIVLLANSSGQQGPATVNDCVSVESTPARLACFDELARHSALVPFKGVPPT